MSRPTNYSLLATLQSRSIIFLVRINSIVPLVLLAVVIRKCEETENIFLLLRT